MIDGIKIMIEFDNEVIRLVRGPGQFSADIVPNGVIKPVRIAGFKKPGVFRRQSKPERPTGSCPR